MDIEAVHNRIKLLEARLLAETVVKPEKGHHEPEYEVVAGGEHASASTFTEKEFSGYRWAVDVPAKTVPNEAERHAAREELDSVYRRCDFFSGRYAAAKALGVEKWELEGHLAYWRRELSNSLGTTIEEDRAILDGRDEWMISATMPDTPKRLQALEDASRLLAISRDPGVSVLLDSAYRGNDDPLVREKAGRSLGYSPLKMWVHEHRDAALVGGVIAAVAASGAIYALIHSLAEK